MRTPQHEREALSQCFRETLRQYETAVRYHAAAAHPCADAHFARARTMLEQQVNEWRARVEATAVDATRRIWGGRDEV